jgi:crossover junction endonuclease MUS81
MTMNVQIIVDSRETKLFSLLTERDLDIYKDNISIQKEQLELGDIHIIFNEITYIYERKTVNDLLSSIKDGRYKEQKNRLLANSFNNNYIIEGDTITSNKNFKNQKTLTSVYLNSIYRDKINVFFTTNIDDTATFLLLLVSKIIEKPENYLNENNKISQDYIDVCKIKSQKNKNIDKDTCYLLQLSQIPNISKEIAKKIKEIYPTMSSLIKALEEQPDEKSKISLLTKIDKIGNQKATLIIDYLSI